MADGGIASQGPKRPPGMGCLCSMYMYHGIDATVIPENAVVMPEQQQLFSQERAGVHGLCGHHCPVHFPCKRCSVVASRCIACCCNDVDKAWVGVWLLSRC